MARNLDNEYEWAKVRYETINARINKELGIKLKEKLKNEGISIANWITENAKKYLEG